MRKKRKIPVPLSLKAAELEAAVSTLRFAIDPDGYGDKPDERRALRLLAEAAGVNRRVFDSAYAPSPPVTSAPRDPTLENP